MKTPRIGDLFTYDGQSYKVARVPSFSTVEGENVNDKGQPNYIRVKVREIELI